MSHSDYDEGASKCSYRDVSNPNGLHESFRHITFVNLHGVGIVFQTRTGFMSHSDHPLAIAIAYEQFVSNPNGLHESFRLIGSLSEYEGEKGFNPERASRVI